MVSSLAPTRSEALWDKRGFGLPFLYRKHAPSILYGTEKSTSRRRASVIVMEEMAKSADEVFVATEDGSAGTRGNVLDAVREHGIRADVVCACGPLPMLRAVRQYAARQGIPAFLSLEERMACGVGVCLGCVTKTTKTDAHSQVNNARVCVEGPVFAAEDVDL